MEDWLEQFSFTSLVCVFNYLALLLLSLQTKWSMIPELKISRKPLWDLQAWCFISKITIGKRKKYKPKMAQPHKRRRSIPAKQENHFHSAIGLTFLHPLSLLITSMFFTSLVCSLTKSLSWAQRFNKDTRFKRKNSLLSTKTKTRNMITCSTRELRTTMRTQQLWTQREVAIHGTLIRRPCVCLILSFLAGSRDLTLTLILSELNLPLRRESTNE